MCERRGLSIIWGGVKEAFYCPREISIFFFLDFGSDTWYYLSVTLVFYDQNLCLFISCLRPNWNVLPWLISMKVRIMASLGGKEGLVTERRSMDSFSGRCPNSVSWPEWCSQVCSPFILCYTFVLWGYCSCFICYNESLNIWPPNILRC